MRYLTFAFIFFCAISCGLLKELPEYIQVCKRDPNTINDCVLQSIEAIKPHLLIGIPEIDVPSLEPFYIPEIKSLTPDSIPVRASAHNVKVTGASDYKIKSLDVDVDTKTIKARVRFTKLHLEGEYTVDGRILILYLKGKGKIHGDATKADAELNMRWQVIEKDGVEYMKFTKMDVNINIKDYNVELDGLFNGDKTLGEATNAAINQNRADFLKAVKPYLESTVSKVLIEIANKVVEGLRYDQLLPEA